MSCQTLLWEYMYLVSAYNFAMRNHLRWILIGTMTPKLELVKNVKILARYPLLSQIPETLQKNRKAQSK